MKISFLKLKCFRLKEIFSLRSMNPITNCFDIVFNLTSLGREQKKYIDFIRSVIDKVYDKYVR